MQCIVCKLGETTKYRCTYAADAELAAGALELASFGRSEHNVVPLHAPVDLSQLRLQPVVPATAVTSCANVNERIKKANEWLTCR